MSDSETLAPCPPIMYVCEPCSDGNPEGCGFYERGKVRLSPDGVWRCEDCYSEEREENWPSWLAAPQCPEVVALPRRAAGVDREAVLGILAPLQETAVARLLDATEENEDAWDHFANSLAECAEAIRALPAAEGGEVEELRAALTRIRRSCGLGGDPNRVLMHILDILDEVDARDLSQKGE